MDLLASIIDLFPFLSPFRVSIESPTYTYESVVSVGLDGQAHQ